MQGEFVRAVALLHDLIDACQAREEWLSWWTALHNLADVRLELGDLAGAADAHERSRVAFDRTGDVTLADHQEMRRLILGVARGEAAEAVAPLEEVVASMRLAGNVDEITDALGWVAYGLALLGRAEEADAAAEFVHRVERSSDGWARSPGVLRALTLAGLGRDEEAKEAARAALTERLRQRSPLSHALALVLLAELCARSGRSEEAAEYLAREDATVRNAGGRRWPLEEARRARVAATLAGHAFASPPPVEPAPVPSLPAPDEHLADRERDVLALLARGHTNKQIAATLSLSEHTVRAHVRHIFEKFGARTRTEAVGEAVRRGFVRLTPPGSS